MVDGGAPLFFDSPFSSGESEPRCAPRGGSAGEIRLAGVKTSRKFALLVLHRVWSCARAGINVSRLILLIYLLPRRPTIRNCTRMRRIPTDTSGEQRRGNRTACDRKSAKLQAAEREIWKEREGGDTARDIGGSIGKCIPNTERDHNGSSTTIEFRR